MSNTRDKMAEATKLAEDLLGTCDSPPETLEDDLELCEFLDDQVRRCDTCDWWVETHEIDCEGNCTSCAEEVAE